MSVFFPELPVQCNTMNMRGFHGTLNTQKNIMYFCQFGTTCIVLELTLAFYICWHFFIWLLLNKKLWSGQRSIIWMMIVENLFAAKVEIFYSIRILQCPYSMEIRVKSSPRLCSQAPIPAPSSKDNTFVSTSEYRTSRENKEFFPTRAILRE